MLCAFFPSDRQEFRANTLDIRDLLPPALIKVIRERYLAAVADAEQKFMFSEADEDSLTGALGNAISMAKPMVFYSDSGAFDYQISYQKVRGRGPGAPERRYGIDGLFQIEVTDREGRVLLRKGLPFQAKKHWEGTDSRLVEQMKAINLNPCNAIVVDYDRSGYSACS